MSVNNNKVKQPIHYLDEGIKAEPFIKLALDFFLQSNAHLVKQWANKTGGNNNLPVFWLPWEKKWVFDDRTSNHKREVSNRADQVR